MGRPLRSRMWHYNFWEISEFFLVRRNQNKDKTGEDHEHSVVGATSSDTRSAAIFGLRGKKDISVFIMYPTGRVSQMQEAQMTTVADKNSMFLVS
jgi:threonine synthase